KTLAVSVAEHAGQLRVSWDPTEPAVRAADGLQVRSVDDGMIEFDRVTRKQLAGGMFLYNRKSTDVLLDMALEQNGRQTRRATVRYLSTPPVPQAARVP
ncbi:MAG TPA: hypothetical protein VES20_21860, partial [Bryobacteraceae bacterium]|nr:hypothetical protein [Bryobacteraceae bacterium]